MSTTRLELQRDDSRLQGNLLDQRLEGPLQISEHGRPQARLEYRDGVLHGTSTLYHPNGQVSALMPHAQGRPHGQARFYSDEGWLQRTINYRNGLMHGKASSYFANGQVAEQACYHEGILHGPLQRFHPNGQLALNSRYAQGQSLGTPLTYDAQGHTLDEQGRRPSRLRIWLDNWREPRDN
ncbi:toxin-antitoxin system YwqK family antitoxin [Stutzerimonas kirkiae]|uniref:Toxin-antitoxin system YwqK family antitoxin n=1 Tax=Stutzerimonas kirkiae TaxID=2211392 RepID=A0A4Q9QZV1_9GAMM|nr:toxin-antitoxin system YwqK family antitoxin [Stutzerimonas kirkiae]TBU91645.1 toxin-antitoxin system YwqK family antitoxin [Stutzerimonas kirkiae]TBV00628.1 toxin-antitoxin system YwqK family antitoxin [Stutzerimonas kirkiae]